MSAGRSFGPAVTCARRARTCSGLRMTPLGVLMVSQSSRIKRRDRVVCRIGRSRERSEPSFTLSRQFGRGSVRADRTTSAGRERSSARTGVRGGRSARTQRAGALPRPRAARRPPASVPPCADHPRVSWQRSCSPPPAPRSPRRPRRRTRCRRRGASSAACGSPPSPTSTGRRAPASRPTAQQAELRRDPRPGGGAQLNAVVLQVRPRGDALYRSKLEPWSEYLTGAQGRAARRRTTTRSRSPSPRRTGAGWSCTPGSTPTAPRTPSRSARPSRRTHIVAAPARSSCSSTARYLWMDPGEPAVQRAHRSRVILDVVSRYDIDGVHIDDYFYPYPETDAAGSDDRLPRRAELDSATAPGGGRAGARRLAARERQHARAAAVPRGAPRQAVGEVRHQPVRHLAAGLPAEIVTGFDQYAQLYADARKWLREGWVRLLHAAALLADRAARAELPQAAATGGCGENVHGPPPVAGQLHQPHLRGRPDPVAGERGDRADPRDARAARRHGERPLQHEGVHAEPRQPLRAAGARGVPRPRAPAGHPLAGARPPRRPAARRHARRGRRAVTLRAGGGTAPLWWAVRARAAGRGRWTCSPPRAPPGRRPPAPTGSPSPPSTAWGWRVRSRPWTSAPGDRSGAGDGLWCASAATPRPRPLSPTAGRGVTRRRATSHAAGSGARGRIEGAVREGGLRAVPAAGFQPVGRFQPAVDLPQPLLDARVGHEPHQRHQHVERVGDPRVDERQRDRRGVERAARACP